MIKKLRIKFVAINMTIVTVMICVIMGMMYFFTRADFENQSLRMMKNTAVSPVKPDISLNHKEQVHLPYFTFKLGSNGEKVTVRGGYYDLSNEKLLNDLVSITNMENKRTGVLKDYKLRYCVVDTNVVEPDRSDYAFKQPHAVMAKMAPSDITQSLIDENYYPIMPLSEGFIITDEAAAGSVNPILSSSAASYSKKDGYDLETYEKEEADTDGPFALALEVDTANEGKIIWFNSSFF